MGISKTKSTKTKNDRYWQQESHNWMYSLCAQLRVGVPIGCADKKTGKSKVTWSTGVLCRADQVQRGVTEARCDAKTNP